MKKILIYILISLLVSCSLEETIYDKNTSDNFIQGEDNVESLMNGVYSNFTEYGLYKNSLQQYFLLYGGNDLGSLNGTFNTVNTRTISPLSSSILNVWSNFYTIINNSNILLQSVEEADVLSDEYKSRIIGELHFIRGFCYFNLVRLFGDVPINKEPVTGASNLYPVRNSVEEVYELVFEDLNIAAEKCLLYSEQPVAEKGRANKGAAQSILALAYLTYANNLALAGESGSSEYYQLAKSFADAVIQSGEYQLVNDYATLWDVNKEASSYNEVIFGIQFARDAITANAWAKGSSFAYYTQPSIRYDVTGYVNGRGSSYLRVQPWFYDIYNQGEYENDYRTEVSFLTRFRYQYTDREVVTYPEISTKSNDVIYQYPFLDKYKDPNGLQARNGENDYFIMRLSEVYLIKAEAENELNGPTATAYEAFNKLRERARMADGNARTTPADLEAGLSKDEFRLRVFNERGLELIGEGHRWFDMVRTRYTDNTRTMAQYYYEDFYPSMGSTTPPTYNKTTSTWEGGRVINNSVVSWSKKFLLWPIPGIEIDSNPNLTQNHEYGW